MLSDTATQVASIADALSEQAVLETAVAVACHLVGADYGAALLLGADGQASALAHQGMTSDQVAALPRLPGAVGLIALVLRGETLRTDDMGAHPEAVGFPLRHVPMSAMLGLPVVENGRVLGALLLTRSPEHGVFTQADEVQAGAVARLAGRTVAALRGRVAHVEVLDQLGATVHRSSDGSAEAARSPVVARLLDAVRDALDMDVAVLSRIEDGTQSVTQVATRSDDSGPVVRALDLFDAADGYCQLMLDGEVPASVPDLAQHALTADRRVGRDLGIGAYCGVAVVLPDGSPYGSLCAVSSAPGRAATSAQVAVMTVLARLIGVRLQEERLSEERRSARKTAFLPLLLESARRTVVLQPVVTLDDGRTVGFEALTRFYDPHGAPRRPDEVFAEAHDLGVGSRLEQAAARSALALLPELPATAFLSLNLSPRALLLPATVDLLSQALRDGAAGRLVVELTEHELVEDYPALLNLLAGLRGRGLRLAVDDTGAGFASLQHVVLLQPDVVKLDVAFVRDVHLDPARRAVARSVIGLSREIGADLIAEGIERGEEQDVLRGLGAVWGQGYHLGRPLPPDLALAAAG